MLGNDGLARLFGLVIAQGLGRLADGRFVPVLVWVAVLLVVLVVGAYWVRRIRSEPAQRVSSANELLAKFREAHGRGELTDEEYRTIKTMLGEELDRELSGTGEKD